MKVYEWQETESHFIAYIRPSELFDLTTLEKPSPDEQEARLRALHTMHNQMEGFAIAYSKKKGKEFAEKALEDSPDIYAARDQKDLETFHSTHAKKPALEVKKPALELKRTPKGHISI